jgi:hypothetical protein
MATNANADRASADVNWATLPGNNVTDWDIANVEWASANVYRASADYLLFTSANVDWASFDADWVTFSEFNVTDWASNDQCIFHYYWVISLNCTQANWGTYSCIFFKCCSITRYSFLTLWIPPLSSVLPQIFSLLSLVPLPPVHLSFLQMSIVHVQLDQPYCLQHQ